MAQRVEYILVDDLDGGPAAETVTFALDGASYEIDLSDDNARQLRDDLSRWVGHARRTGGGGRRPAGGRRQSAKRTDLSAIREWARANGRPVSDRGRISAEVQAAYDRAHS
ncbi:MAG TPA: Lsr2 family protein [Intrasporangium sp.]|uniref:histone-like nucleoid-structuring protein Lsr2 n=1 Tax=Intrasporangium sp. TaxID=1925024 RepID=UPI002D78A4A0|nr:Lsr2 family protein [Intrasporangium sp.]HET7398894.1 Lsr2 family protein [Intrasporangium sp.]